MLIKSIHYKESLELNNIYVVYGIIFSSPRIEYEILTSHDLYPVTYPSDLFEVIDNRLSRFFVLGEIVSGSTQIFPFLTFKEWATDNSFYGRLVDGDKKARDIFNYYKTMFEFEFKHPDIKQYATAVGVNWVQCPICTEAWELEYQFFEMCKCPKCKTVLLINESR